MDWLVEALPIFIFIILSILSQMFNKGDKEQPRRQTPASEREREDAQRRVQEEIRRRIAERQRQRESGEEPARPQPEQQTQPASREKEGYDPFSSDQQQRKPYAPQQQPQPVRRPEPQPAMARQHQPEPVQTTTGPSIEDQLSQQMQALEAAKRARAKAIEQAKANASSIEDAYGIRGARTSAAAMAYTGNFRRDLVTQINSTYGIKQAFVISEILGKPMALKDEPSGVS